MFPIVTKIVLIIILKNVRLLSIDIDIQYIYDSSKYTHTMHAL